MDSKKGLFGIIVFLLALVVILDFNNIYGIFVPPTDPLDAIYEYDEQEVSVRKLFEASYEDIQYSNHWVATGAYNHKYESVTYSKKDDTSTTDIIDKGSINLRYDHYNVGEDNYFGILSGDCVEYYSDFSFEGDLNSQSKVATYKFYDGIINGYTKTVFEYTGHPYSYKLNVEKLLMPDFNNMSEVSIWFDGSVDEQGHFVVTFVGDKGLPCLVSAFYGYNEASPFQEAIYTFDAKSRKIISVNLIYNHSSGGYGEEKRISTSKIDLTIDSIEYGDCDIPEIPKMICENSLINGVITGDETFNPSSVIRNDASNKSSTSSTISNIWQNAVSSVPNEPCTLEEFSDSLSEKAAEYDMDIVKKDYTINERENCILIRYTITQDNDEIGYIIMPITVYSAQLYNDNNLLVSADDEISVLENGVVWITHKVTSSISTETCYHLYTNGKLTLDHRITRETAFSRLSDTDELSEFAFEDFAKLKKFVDENKNDKDFTRLDKYEILEDGEMNKYYVVDDKCYTDDLAYTYDLPIISRDYVMDKTNDDEIVKEATWKNF